MAQCNFADDEGMDQHAADVQEFDEQCIILAQMVDPNGGIDEDQVAAGRRRRGASRSGSACNAPCAFAFDKRFQSLSDQARLLLQSGEGLSLRHKFVVERQRRTHAEPPS